MGLALAEAESSKVWAHPTWRARETVAGLGRKWGAHKWGGGKKLPLEDRGGSGAFGSGSGRAQLTLLSHPHAWHPRQPQAGAQETAAVLTRIEAGALGELGLANQGLAVRRPNVYTHSTAALLMGSGPHHMLPLTGTPPPIWPRVTADPSAGKTKSAGEGSLGPALTQ